MSSSDPNPPPSDPPDVLAGLPDDLAAVLRDQSITLPQDSRVFDLIGEWAKAPSNTASAGPLPLPSDPHKGGETWIECYECGWNLGVDHMFSGFVSPTDPKPTDACPACGEPLIEVVPASTLQSLTAQRDEAIKRAEEVVYVTDQIEGICRACSGSGVRGPEGGTCSACDGSGTEWVKVKGIAQHELVARAESAEQQLAQLQAAHRADLQRVAGEISRIINKWGASPKIGDKSLFDELGALNFSIQSLSTKEDDDA